MIPSRNGVFTCHPTNPQGCQLIAEHGRWPADLPASTAERLVLSALNHDLDAIWIAPGCIVSHLARCPETSHGLQTETDTVAVRAQHDGEGRLTCMHLWCKHGVGADRRTIRIFFPEWDERWDLQGVRDPYQLLNTIDIVEGLLGIALDWSPGSSGKALLTKLNSAPGRSDWLRPVDFTGTPWNPTDLELIAGQDVPQAVSITEKHWPNLKDLDTTIPVFFHNYDKSYGFGGACTRVHVGAGDPIFQPYSKVTWDKKYPGVWKLPTGKWVYTPTMNFLLAQGMLAPEQIQEAWIWKEYHQTLRSWAELFWDLEVRTSEHPHARRVGKRIRSIALGWLAMDTRNWRETPDRTAATGQFYRPDIWWTVVSELWATMRRTIIQMRDAGYDACWRNIDELGFFSNDPDPRSAVPILTREGLGAFHHKYSLRMDDDILYAFADGVPFQETHALLLAKWHEQQELIMNTTLLMPSVSVPRG